MWSILMMNIERFLLILDEITMMLLNKEKNSNNNLNNETFVSTWIKFDWRPIIFESACKTNKFWKWNRWISICFDLIRTYWYGNDMTMKTMATVINMNVMWRSIFRWRFCRLRSDDESKPLGSVAETIERWIELCRRTCKR